MQEPGNATKTATKISASGRGWEREARLAAVGKKMGRLPAPSRRGDSIMPVLCLGLGKNPPSTSFYREEKKKRKVESAYLPFING